MFQDRLVNSEDRLWFDKKMRSKMADFGVEDSEVLGEGPLLYGDFMVPNTDNKIYEEILDQEKVCGVLVYWIEMRLQNTVTVLTLFVCVLWDFKDLLCKQEQSLFKEICIVTYMYVHVCMIHLC